MLILVLLIIHNSSEPLNRVVTCKLSYKILNIPILSPKCDRNYHIRISALYQIRYVKQESYAAWNENECNEEYTLYISIRYAGSVRIFVAIYNLH